jgi:hypothetical protein
VTFFVFVFAATSAVNHTDTLSSVLKTVGITADDGRQEAGVEAMNAGEAPANPDHALRTDERKTISASSVSPSSAAATAAVEEEVNDDARENVAEPGAAQGSKGSPRKSKDQWGIVTINDRVLKYKVSEDPEAGRELLACTDEGVPEGWIRVLRRRRGGTGRGQLECEVKPQNHKTLR